MFPEGEKFLWEGMVFLAFALVCGALVERRFSRLVSAAVAGGALMGICLLQGALLAHGLDRTLVLTLLPLTAYVPAVLVLHELSRSGALATAAVWLVGFVVYFAQALSRLCAGQSKRMVAAVLSRLYAAGAVFVF